MIPESEIQAWREFAPWSEAHQVEQDLVLTRAVIELYSNPILKDAFAFRGGTAMQKLFLNPPLRYSEDIDLVQIPREPIGATIDAIRKHLDPWLGEPQRNRKPDRFTLVYHFTSEIAPVKPMRLKVEINTGEHLTVLSLQRKKIEAKTSWFSGEAEALTYETEELLGTKLRALYQRKKGRDLFDMGTAIKHFPKLDHAKVIHCFEQYMAHKKIHVTRAQYEANIHEKMNDPVFAADILPLLPSTSVFDAAEAYQQVKELFVARLPGDPRKGNETKESKTRPKRK